MTFQYFSGSKKPRDPRRALILKKGYGKNWPSQRKKALERDQYTCQKCGHVGQRKGRKWDIHIHHIIKIKNFVNSVTQEIDYEAANDLSNLTTLCDLGCHKFYDSHQNDSGFVQLK